MTIRAQCDRCTPEGFDHNQRPDEAAVYVPRLKEWLCEVCRKAKGVTNIPDTDGIHADINELDYHADRTSLSSSGARKLLPPSCPAIFRYEQDQPPTPTPQFDVGHAVHALVLGVGQDIVTIDADNWKTKAAQEQRDEAHADGKTPLLIGDMIKAQAMATRVREHPIAAALFAAGDPELSGYWHDPETGVRLRFRTDWLHPGRQRIIAVDLKTTAGTADPGVFAKSCAAFGYHQQNAWYLDGLAGTETSDDAALVFVIVSKEPPHLVTVAELDPDDIDRGRRLNRKAIQLYAACAATDTWPGFGDGIHQISLPSYARFQEESALK